MSSSQRDSQNLQESTRSSQSQNRVSFLLIVGGLILIVLALVMFIYARTYSPKQTEYVFEGRIERVPPAVTVGSLLIRPSAPSDPAPFKQQRNARSKPPSSTRRVLLGDQSVSRDEQPGSGAQPDQSQTEALKPEQAIYRGSGFSSGELRFLPVSFFTTALQRAGAASFEGLVTDLDSQLALGEERGTLQAAASDKPKKPNVLRRFFRWFSGLFKKKKPPRNHSPVISSVTLSQTTVVVRPNCPEGSTPEEGRCTPGESLVVVKIVASDADGDEINLKPVNNVGRVSSEISTSVMNWNLEGVVPGVYEFK